MDKEEFEALKARVRQLESFLGHIHVPSEPAAVVFQEYPKQVGDQVVFSAEEEAKLTSAAKPVKTPKESSTGLPQ